MKLVPLIGLALAIGLGLTACGDQNGGGGLLDLNALGAGSGNSSGAPAGYVITGGSEGTVMGVGAGGLTGGKVGDLLDGGDKAAAGESAARAAELQIGEKVTWAKSDTQPPPANGWASPSGSAFQDTGGRSCRFVHEQATLGDHTAEDTVKLCNGSTGWVRA